MAAAVRNVDFSESSLIKESYWVSAMTYGSFRYKDLRDMPFPEYEALLARVAKDAEERKNGTG